MSGQRSELCLALDTGSDQPDDDNQDDRDDYSGTKESAPVDVVTWETTDIFLTNAAWLGGVKNKPNDHSDN